MPLFSSAFARRTVTLLFLGVLALLVIVAAAGWLTARTGAHTEEVIRERDVRMVAGVIQTALLDAETGQRGYLLTGETRYLEPYTASLPTIREGLATLSGLYLQQDRPDERLVQLKTGIEDKLSELAETVDLTKAGRRDEALALVKTDRGKIAMDRIRTTLGGLIAEAEGRVFQRLADLTLASRLLLWVSGVGALLIVLFGAGAAWVVVQYTAQLVAARHELQLANASLEERVAERTTSLTRANEEIQRFAYIVSHDLRSPLVNIMGFTSELEVGAEALKRYLEGDAMQADRAKTAALEDIPEAIRFIRASTGRMDTLINAILKLSREGRRELNPEPVDLVKLFAATAASVQHQLDEAGATLTVPDKAPVIVSDRLALEQVVGNVVDNAVKYLARDRPGRIAIVVSQSPGRIGIAVSDNGRGIAEQDRERIFELFRRAGAQDRPGEGIGLAHVRALARRLGGDISVRSELGRGSTFQIDLPLRLRVGDSHISLEVTK
ncbi:sensor histidine kinase [Reyranella sp.]|uniref:sensor histidine kinase n=1 Tax=Reyranella sp. TaxID=1929291 RepID=UPI003D13974F